MQDRDVTIQVPMKASQIEVTRAMCLALSEFPTIAWNYADQVAEYMLGDEQDAGAKLAQLVAGLKQDAERAHQAVLNLKPMIDAARITDPDASKEWLQ